MSDQAQEIKKVEEPVATEAQEKKEQEKNLNNMYLAMFVSTTLLGLALVYWMKQPGNTIQPNATNVAVLQTAGASHASKIILIDQGKVLNLAVQKLMKETQGIEHEVIAKKSRQLLTDAVEVANSYAKEGYIVMNKAAVLAAPDAIDFTADYAKRMGVELVP